MKLTELQQAVRTADPAAILVPLRVMSRVIQEVCKLPGLLWEVPHQTSFVLDRHVLFRHVEQDELDLEPDRLLPPTVILLTEPDPEKLPAAAAEPLLLEYWRRLFHANLHLALDKLGAEGRLTLADITERIQQIGRAEFEEIRLVLGQDRYLLPPEDERVVYIEFAAVFLELRYFAANLLPTYFPGLRDLERVERLLTRDVDAAALFTRTRLPGAPDPVVRTDPRSDESNDYYWRLIHHAERAARAGNTVRSAILRTRAARVAPASLTLSTRVGAEADLQQLMTRLQAALQLSDAEIPEWLKDLPALLDKADQGRRPIEAALLYDLQRVCLDHERTIYTLDVMEWLLSGGKRPIKRPLPGQRLVRLSKHLRSAGQRLTKARLTDAARQHLAGLIEAAVNQTEERLRQRFRPVLTDALLDVGLEPANLPERMAFHKLIEELLDRINEFGFLTFSDLRDAISRNQLKMPDPADPQDFVRGDPLLRLDRRLATLLDGVYRPSEFYLRWLERFTSLGFGTPFGRLVTRFLTVPFGGAYVLVEGTDLTLKHYELPGLSAPTKAGLILGLATLVLALLNWTAFRHRLTSLAVRTGRLLRTVFIDFPAWVARLEPLRRVVSSWPFQLAYWYLFKPLVACAVIWWWFPYTLGPGWGWGVPIFLAVTLILNSRFGKAVVQAVVKALVQMYELLRNGLLPGLLRLVMAFFKQIVDAVEYVLFSVDEWLRFRSGDSRATLVLLTVLGVLWYPVSFVARFYMVVLIEPGFNPLKAPVSYLAAKFIYPPLFAMLPGLVRQMEQLIPGWLATAVTVSTLWLVPDVFGFLFWEMKENWRLYRANRGPLLRPVRVGPHGESVQQLLHPSFHSGTIPRLYARLRKAEHEASETGNWRAARGYRQSLQAVERSLRRLVARELVSLLETNLGWKEPRVRVGQVALAANRVRLELLHADYPASPVWMEWQEEAGWLVADIPQAGWLESLTPEQRRTATTALAGLYKLAGVDLVREQIAGNLPRTVAGYDVTERDLVLWLDQRHGKSVLYDLTDLNGQLRPRSPDGAAAPGWPVLEACRLMFGPVPLSWQEWVESWRKDRAGQLPPTLVRAGVRLLPEVGPSGVASAAVGPAVG